MSRMAFYSGLIFVHRPQLHLLSEFSDMVYDPTRSSFERFARYFSFCPGNWSTIKTYFYFTVQTGLPQQNVKQGPEKLLPRKRSRKRSSNQLCTSLCQEMDKVCTLIFSPGNSHEDCARFRGQTWIQSPGLFLLQLFYSKVVMPPSGSPTPLSHLGQTYGRWKLVAFMIGVKEHSQCPRQKGGSFSHGKLIGKVSLAGIT